MRSEENNKLKNCITYICISFSLTCETTTFLDSSFHECLFTWTASTQKERGARARVGVRWNCLILNFNCWFSLDLPRSKTKRVFNATFHSLPSLSNHLRISLTSNSCKFLKAEYLPHLFISSNSSLYHF